MRHPTLVPVFLFMMLFLGFCGTTPSAVAEPPFRVIANPGVSVDSMSRTEICDLFLKKTTTWPEGSSVLPVDLTLDSAVRDAFSRTVLQRDPSAVKNYWLRQIYSGNAVPPREFNSARDVVAFVRLTPGAIGYVGTGTRLDGVQIIEIADQDSL